MKALTVVIIGFIALAFIVDLLKRSQRRGPRSRVDTDSRTLSADDVNPTGTGRHRAREIFKNVDNEKKKGNTPVKKYARADEAFEPDPSPEPLPDPMAVEVPEDGPDKN